MASTCLKNAVAPQLSVCPICAYGPESARSPQATIGAFPEALVPEDELPQPAMAMAAAAATASAARTRLLIDLLLMVAASHS